MKRSEKWASISAEVNGLTDSTGKSVDPGIRPVVTGLRALGINTVASCEGHRDRGLSPHVSVGGEDLHLLSTRQHQLLRNNSPAATTERYQIVRQMERGREEQRKRAEPLVREFNQQRPKGKGVEIRHGAVGLDRIQAECPSLTKRILGRGLAEKQGVMRDFGKFLREKAS